ncbi:MAG: GxxExxY protein [Chlamydiota bacterium]|nr:GxxExxY protein [Chlamydiota bacterium]
MELCKARLDVKSQKPITVTYENEIVGEFIADILVNDTIILELSCLYYHPLKN